MGARPRTGRPGAVESVVARGRHPGRLRVTARLPVLIDVTCHARWILSARSPRTRPMTCWVGAIAGALRSGSGAAGRVGGRGRGLVHVPCGRTCVDASPRWRRREPGGAPHREAHADPVRAAAKDLGPDVRTRRWTVRREIRDGAVRVPFLDWAGTAGSIHAGAGARNGDEALGPGDAFSRRWMSAGRRSSATGRDRSPC
jgi:hypothetical protein